jgi:pimeloyl-ACP methyl ester carboxylesterase
MPSVILLSATLLACSSPPLDPPPEVVIARFDPEARVIPMPTDILRDPILGRLDLPVDEAETAAERELYEYFNQLDGWSTAMSATVDFSAPLSPESLDRETVQVWRLEPTGEQTRIEDVRFELGQGGTRLSIHPPREGWTRSGRYAVMVRGGDDGVRGARGEPVVADAAFYFLRLREPLDDPAHQRAFPGDTRAERADNARRLEEIRLDLAELFDFFEGRQVPREEVASLFSFTATNRTELAMDKASQRMPLPIDLLIDPATGRVDLPPAPWDSATVLEAKRRLADYDGFGTSARLLFGFTAPIDPETVNAETVTLYRVSGGAVEKLDATVTVLEDATNVEVEPLVTPLEEGALYAVAVGGDVRDAGGGSITRMPVGHLLMAREPVADGERSEIGSIDDADAVRLERVRAALSPALERIGRDPLLGAWTFTTMVAEQPLRDRIAAAYEHGVSPDPLEVEHMTPGQALLDFPLAIASLFSVGDVYHGAIESPVFLDPTTRGWREDGSHQVERIKFTLTVPEDAPPGAEVPVVIFGHGVMTERRFVLAIGDALASRGFAAIAIDLPYHGERTYCFSEGPLTIPNPSTGELTPLGDPCAGGAVCEEDGRCRAPGGGPGELARWPIIGMYRSSGAAFLEIEHIANTRDHFVQALIDLTALDRSLRSGDWEQAVGVRFDPDRISYAGQSLGGILGASFVALTPEIERAVLNVPGADTVDMFSESPFFSLQIEAFFDREGVEPSSFDGHRFLNVARWFMDAADPQGVAHHLRGRDVLLQMATLDFIIPNDYTRKLETIAEAPRIDYVAEHGFLVIPIEPAYFPGTRDLAEFIAGELTP